MPTVTISFTLGNSEDSGHAAWSDPDNITTEDGNCASATVSEAETAGATTNILQGLFPTDVAIPSDAIINSYTVRVKAEAGSHERIAISHVILNRSGVPFLTDLGNLSTLIEEGSLADYFYEDSDNSNGITANDIKSLYLTLDLQFENVSTKETNIDVDYADITFDYTVPPGPSKLFGLRGRRAFIKW